MNPFPYSDTNKRYHTYSYYLRRRFGQKVSRVSLHAGFTCPNLDGTRGTGGCSYCSPEGGGEIGGSLHQTIPEQFAAGAAQMDEKWHTGLHIAYFQSHTNTYAAVERLRTLYGQALECSGVVGLAVATRPDCLPDEVCTLLGELAKHTYLTVELGLQTIHDTTGKRINRCHSYAEFLAGYEKLRAYGVNVGVHLINGLPGETPEMMRASARALAALDLHLVKIHMLHLLEGTCMAREWRAQPFPLLTQEEYVAIVCDQLELIPPHFVIGRLTGDGAAEMLIAPEWSRKKRGVLNAIDLELARRQSWQGSSL